MASDVGPTVGVLGGKSRAGKGGVFDDQFAALDGSVREASVSVKAAMVSDRWVVLFASDTWVVWVISGTWVVWVVSDTWVVLFASGTWVVWVVRVGRGCVSRSKERGESEA